MIEKTNQLKKHFPALSNVKCFLDSAASAQKPSVVIDTMNYFSKKVYANVHRGTYDFSEQITTAFEKSRKIVAKFLNADENEIIFTKSATESINLVANSYGSLLEEGDEIIISEMEHHANIIPWQLLENRKKIALKICPILDDGSLDINAFDKLLSPRTKLVAITHISNVLGTQTEIKHITKKAHSRGVKVLVDGTQAVVHRDVDVKDLDVDFYVFTGHKLYAPTGVGVLWGRAEILDIMPPFLGGGDMVDKVTFEKTTFARPPAKFEAGTPPIVQAIGLGAAIEFVQSVGFDKICKIENDLYKFASDEILKIKGAKIIGTSKDKAAILSFYMDGIHPFDIAELLSKGQVCTRVGNHCAQPLMRRFNIDSCIRVSFAMYNDKSDVLYFLEVLKKAIKMLRK